MITTALVLILMLALMALLIGAITLVFALIPTVWVALVICFPIVLLIGLDVFMAVKIIKSIFSK